MNLLQPLISIFFNQWYRFRPPAMVHYWRKNEAARAKVGTDKDGSVIMQIEGEDHPFPGFPRGHILSGILSKLKHTVKTEVFNEVGVKLREIYKEAKPDMLPPHRLAPAVRHIWETFEKLEHMEVTDDMRGRIKLMKEVICFFLQEDDAYRFRTQMFLDLLDQKKVKLSKRDLYFARGKYWKPDMYKRIVGKWFKAFDY